MKLKELENTINQILAEIKKLTSEENFDSTDVAKKMIKIISLRSTLVELYLRIRKAKAEIKTEKDKLKQQLYQENKNIKKTEVDKIFISEHSDFLRREAYVEYLLDAISKALEQADYSYQVFSRVLTKILEEEAKNGNKVL